MVLLCLFFSVDTSFAQIQYSQLEPYNNRRIGPYLTQWSELHFSFNTGLDIDLEEADTGNVAQGINAGFGLGYMYKIGLDDLPQSIGIGVKAEHYPDAYHKFNLMIDHKILAVGDNNRYISAFGGTEINFTYNLDFQAKEMHTIIYMLDLQYNQVELKWGLQSWTDTWIPTLFIDDTFNVFKLTYKYIIPR